MWHGTGAFWQPEEGDRMRFPCTLLDFQAQFPDEASCWVHLREARWPQGFLCPRCASRGSHFLATRRLEQCRSCRYQGSVTAGTVFHGTRVPLRVWFLGIFFLAHHKKGISALQFQRDTGVGSYQTAWTLRHKLRSGLVADPTQRLQGAVETLRRLGIDHRPRKGGRGHQSVHLLPWAHTVFGNLKTWLRGTFHGVSPKHLQHYLDEFVFRFDRRWRETGLFIRVLYRALGAVPCPYQLLTAERIG
jgi:hypothetical protein